MQKNLQFEVIASSDGPERLTGGTTQLDQQIQNGLWHVKGQRLAYNPVPTAHVNTPE
jgi:hypothetical protein